MAFPRSCPVITQSYSPLFLDEIIFESQNRTSPIPIHVGTRSRPATPWPSIVVVDLAMRVTAIGFIILALHIYNSQASRTTQAEPSNFATTSPTYSVASRSPSYSSNTANILEEIQWYDSTYIIPATWLLALYDILSAIVFLTKIARLWV